MFQIVKLSLLDEVLGQRLAHHRKSLKISQEYLAEMLRHDQTYVSKVETGKRQLTVADFISGCNALNLTNDEILDLLNINKTNHE